MTIPQLHRIENRTCTRISERFWTLSLALALSCATSQSVAVEASPSARAPIEDGGCPSLEVRTDNQFLNLSTLAGQSVQFAPVECTTLSPAQYNPRVVDFRTPSDSKLGIGKAGQIYSIRVPGIDEDIIPKQRDDAFYVDEVFQTAATNLAERGASPRGQATTRWGRREPGWHYHQAGAYQRGALSDLPPLFSPLLYNRVNEQRGLYESLNIALQAHPNPSAEPDRFLVFMRIQHLGNDIFELTQGWINNSMNANGTTGEITTALDHFNFPWFVLNNSAAPVVIADVEGRIEDLSDRQWPPGPDDTVSNARWFGAFQTNDVDAPGLAVTLASDGGTRLRLGKAEKRVVLNVAETRSEFQYGPEGIYVVSAVRTGETVKRGEAIVSRSYLLLGRRNEILDKLSPYEQKSFVEKVAVQASNSRTDLILFCGSAEKYQACDSVEAAAFALTRSACSDCMPVFELQDRATQEFVYSTDPFLGVESGTADLVDPEFRIKRILGWLARAETPAPEGISKQLLTDGNEEGIYIDLTDRDSFPFGSQTKAKIN